MMETSKPPQDATPPSPLSGPKTSGDPESYSGRVCKVLNTLARSFAASDQPRKGGVSAGDLAQLRRLDPQRGHASCRDAFWRIVVHHLEPAGLVGPSAGDPTLAPWIAILQGLATLRELHRPGARLGSAMAEAGISEARLTRLLTARGDALLAQLRPLAQQLRSQAQAVDWAEAALLVLSDGRRDADRHRQRVASSYYRQQHHESQEAQEN